MEHDDTNDEVIHFYWDNSGCKQSWEHEDFACLHKYIDNRMQIIEDKFWKITTNIRIWM